MIKFNLVSELDKADCLLVPFWEEEKMDSTLKKFDKVSGGFIEGVFVTGDFGGKRLQTSLLYTVDTDIPRVMLLGFGKEKDTDLKKWKEIFGTAVTACQNKKMKKLAVYLSSAAQKKFDTEVILKNLVVASEIANYSYDLHKTAKEDKVQNIESIDIILDTKNKKLISILEEAQVIVEGVNYSRHLGNIPPTEMTPLYLAEEAVRLTKENKKIKTKIFDKAQIEKLGMGCLLAVARASEFEPRFIVMEYWGANKKEKPIVLVGKGITYDSGGLTLKPRDYLVDMKFDMLGASIVMATIRIAAKLGLKKNIVGLVAAAENMPGGNAFRPDDILVAMNGKTVEVRNTDAEGRLVLADALCYAAKYEPKEVIDLATLTGACMVALGLERSGLFTQDEKLCNKLLQSSATVGEHLWRLPIGEEYSEAMKSEVADYKNDGGVGGARYGGASVGAAFLEFFTSYPWAHIDLASAIYENKGKSWIRVGANGFGVQTMVEYLRKA